MMMSDDNLPEEFNPAWISDWFWDIIQRAHKDRTQLRLILSKLGKEELLRFHSEFVVAAIQLRGERFHPYMEDSEDGVADISDWVVSQGKESYLMVWEHPEKIPYSVWGKAAEDLAGEASDIYEERYDDLPVVEWSPPQSS
jgi:hypothetical protein